VKWVQAIPGRFQSALGSGMEALGRFFGRAWSLLWDGVKRTSGLAIATVVTTFLGMVGALVTGAAKAFGWVPGIGPKLKEASKTFNTFRDDVNKSLGGLKDKSITIQAYTGVSNLGSGAAAARTLSTRRATGGPVFGPGTGTSDSIPTLLSNGEHVWTAKEVSALGGHAAMEQLRGMVRAGRVPAFAAGGGVNVRPTVPSPRTIVDPVERFVDRVGAELKARAEKMAAEMGGDGSGGGMGWRRQMALLRQVFPGLALISGFRPGAITATGNRSYHGMGRAVDIPPLMQVFDWIRARHGRATKELIFSAAGGRQINNGRSHMFSGITRANHWDHIHWAMDKGGLARGVGFMPKLTRRPERVLSPDQTESFERLVDYLPMRGRGGGDLYMTINVSGSVVSERELVAVVRDGLVRMKRNGVPLGIA
jgi:hypothetical protein